MKPALLLLTVVVTCGGPAAEGAGLDRVWRGEGRTVNSPGPLRVLCWNVERGRNFDGVAAALEQHAPDVAILQEVDVNARRSGRRNVAEELGRRFERHWAFGVEFEELGQGSRSSPAYVGQAVLSGLPIGAARVLRFTEQSSYWRPRWFVPNWGVFQRREGGRMALVAELEAAGRTLIVYNAHLESRGPEEVRVRQMEEILADAAKQSPEALIIIAGDFNTRMRPSPVVTRLVQAGFRQAAGSEKSTTARGDALDWIFVRGAVRFTDGKVLYDVQASDHYPLEVRLSFP